MFNIIISRDSECELVFIVLDECYMVHSWPGKKLYEILFVVIFSGR